MHQVLSRCGCFHDIPLGRQKSLGLAPQHVLPLMRHMQGRQGPPRSAGLHAAQETHRAPCLLGGLGVGAQLLALRVLQGVLQRFDIPAAQMFGSAAGSAAWHQAKGRQNTDVAKVQGQTLSRASHCWTLELLFLFFRPKVLSSKFCKEKKHPHQHQHAGKFTSVIQSVVYFTRHVDLSAPSSLHLQASVII